MTKHEKILIIIFLLSIFSLGLTLLLYIDFKLLITFKSINEILKIAISSALIVSPIITYIEVSKDEKKKNNDK